jgi:hypothetical protein
MSAPLSHMRPIPRRGLSRDEAAISARKFDELVAAGRMPPARLINRRKVWDIRAIDAAFDELPYESGATDNDDDWKTAV